VRFSNAVFYATVMPIEDTIKTCAHWQKRSEARWNFEAKNFTKCSI